MTEENVRVIVRARPLNNKEMSEGSKQIVEIDKNIAKVTLVDPTNQQHINSYTFDSVYGENSQQTEIFDESVRQLIDDVMSGYNSTVFAYGQTSSGKTYTMTGNDDGIIPQAVVRIFDSISEMKETKFMVYSSFYEIYQENIRDLMTDARGLKVRENPTKGVYIENLSQHTVSTSQQIYKLMQQGNRHRTTAATKMNDTSSRSHSIFVVTVERSDLKQEDKKYHIRKGKLNLVDLAGSERVDRTGAEGERLKEGIKINLSLSMLGKVISSLVKGDKHISYRDSKLTFLLQDSLGGNAKCLMCANISPASSNYDETKSTLIYASNAKKIVNKVRINEDPKDAMIREMQGTIDQLEKQLAELGGFKLDENGQIVIEEDAEEQKLEKQLRQKKKMQKQAGDQQNPQFAAEIAKMQAQLTKQKDKQRKYMEKAEEIRNEILQAKEQIVDSNVIRDKIDSQERELREKRQLLAQQQVEKRKMKQQILQDEELKKQQKEQMIIITEQIGNDEKKIEALENVISQKQKEMDEMNENHQMDMQREWEILENAKYDAGQWEAICNEYIPINVLELLKKNARFDDEKEEWVIGGLGGFRNGRNVVLE